MKKKTAASKPQLKTPPKPRPGHFTIKKLFIAGLVVLGIGFLAAQFIAPHRKYKSASIQPSLIEVQAPPEAADALTHKRRGAEAYGTWLAITNIKLGLRPPSTERNLTLFVPSQLEAFNNYVADSGLQIRHATTTDASQEHPYDYHIYFQNKFLETLDFTPTCIFFDRPTNTVWFTVEKRIGKDLKNVVYKNGQQHLVIGSMRNCPIITNDDIYYISGRNLNSPYNDVMNLDQLIVTFEDTLSGQPPQFFLDNDQPIIINETEAFLGQQRLNDREQLATIIAFTYFGEDEVFVFKSAGKYYLYYKDGLLPQNYDEIIYSDWRLDPFETIDVSANRIKFLGRRGQNWYYVVLSETSHKP